MLINVVAVTEGPLNDFFTLKQNRYVGMYIICRFNFIHGVFTYLATCRFTNEVILSSIQHKDVNILIRLINFNDAFSSRQKSC